MDCGDTLSETVGAVVDAVSGAGVVLLLLLLLLPPFPHAVKKSTMPATAVTSNFENFCRAMKRLAG
jgi:hypothetical protein